MLVVADNICAMDKPRFPEAISVRLTSEILGVSQKSVRRWIMMGYIRAYRVGPHLIRIPRTEVARMRRIRHEAAVEDEIPRYPVVD